MTDTIFGCSHTVYDTVKVSITPNANFSGTPLFGCAPLTTNFTDVSSINGNAPITNWSWNFGDGNTSTLQNPAHIYNTPGVYTVSLTVTDSIGCPNTETKNAYTQAIGPDVNFGANQTIICPNTTVNFTDSTIFGAPITSWTWDFGDASPNSNLQNPSHTYTSSGIYTVSLTVTDIDGCTRTYTINNYIDARDTLPPVISCPANITVNTDAGLCTSSANFGNATATDNCTASPTIINNAPANFPIGNTTVTWTATDAAGNIDTCSQIVTVVDNENPIITCPANITVIGDSNCNFIITDYTNLAVSTDNCTTNPTITQFPVVGSTINSSGNHIITLTATDAAGNSNTCTFNVIISDTTAPIVNCIANQQEFLDENCEFELLDYSTLISSSDNCDVNININQIPAPGTVYNSPQTIPVSVTFTDVTGNTNNCSFNVDVAIDQINSGCSGNPIIATLLTPNGDGKNDTWIIREQNFIKNCSVVVINRWGQKVFETTNYNNDWDGSNLPDGDYYYIITCPSGENYKGPVTILRSNQ